MVFIWVMVQHIWLGNPVICIAFLHHIIIYTRDYIYTENVVDSNISQSNLTPDLVILVTEQIVVTCLRLWWHGFWSISVSSLWLKWQFHGKVTFNKRSMLRSRKLRMSRKCMMMLDGAYDNLWCLKTLDDAWLCLFYEVREVRSLERHTNRQDRF